MHFAKFAAFLSTVWTRLKGVLGKMAPKGFIFLMRKRSRSGDETDVLLSTYDADTVVRLLQASPAPLLRQLPSAVGGDCPTAPRVAANPEPLAPQLAYFY